MKAKKIIKGIAKTTGKYTLKGLGKGVELTSRGAIKTVNALVKNPRMDRGMDKLGKKYQDKIDDLFR